MKFKSDIDIDVGDRDRALAMLKHIPAGMCKDDKIIKHNTGVYFTDIPVDPVSNSASIDYKQAEERGYVKIDILNVTLYQQIKSEDHLNQLLAQEPEWHKLYDPEFCAKLIHIGSHYDTLIKMPEVVDSIPRLAMFLAVIRPAKRHLIGRPWQEVALSIWDRPSDNSYYFKKAHAVGYAHLVTVNMNLLNLACVQE